MRHRSSSGTFVSKSPLVFQEVDELTLKPTDITLLTYR